MLQAFFLDDARLTRKNLQILKIIDHAGDATGVAVKICDSEGNVEKISWILGLPLGCSVEAQCPGR